jgi:hypothetical protein
MVSFIIQPSIYKTTATTATITTTIEIPDGLVCGEKKKKKRREGILKNRPRQTRVVSFSRIRAKTTSHLLTKLFIKMSKEEMSNQTHGLLGKKQKRQQIASKLLKYTNTCKKVKTVNKNPPGRTSAFSFARLCHPAPRFSAHP